MLINDFIPAGSDAGKSGVREDQCDCRGELLSAIFDHGYRYASDGFGEYCFYHDHIRTYLN